MRILLPTFRFSFFIFFSFSFRCFDACLVIDGSLSFKFNDGMRAVIEIKDEDALRFGN